MEKYYKILEEIEKENLGMVELYFIWQAKDFDLWQEMSENQQIKLINYIYEYWLNEETIENYAYNILDIILNKLNEETEIIIENIDTIEYKEFEKIINKYI